MNVLSIKTATVQGLEVFSTGLDRSRPDSTGSRPVSTGGLGGALGGFGQGSAGGSGPGSIKGLSANSLKRRKAFRGSQGAFQGLPGASQLLDPLAQWAFGLPILSPQTWFVVPKKAFGDTWVRLD